MNQKHISSEITELADGLDQGLIWLDKFLYVSGCNSAYRRMLELEDAPDFVGRPYRELVQHLNERGEFFDKNPDFGIEQRMMAKTRGEALQFERVRPNGVALSVKGNTLPSGGYFYSYLDVTREREAKEMLRRGAKATVVAMANFAEHRDTDTGVHVLRVARLVGQTARKLMQSGASAFAAIDEELIEHLATASILHDVGKISTPDRVLLKNGPLSPDEREIIKKHTLDGAKLLSQANLTMGANRYLELGQEIALTHHERFDGAGYPHGLAGTDIPLSGRITAICDVYDALTSRRPYKLPWTGAQALQWMGEQSGTQFDPDVLAAFMEVMRERQLVQLVQWRDEFSVGDQHIDEQHLVLMDTINQLASAESLNNHHCVLMIIDELASYASFHFDYEEGLMERCGYPDLANHKKIHRAFVTWVNTLRDNYFKFGKRPLGDEVLAYLRDWLSRHILGEDQRYRPYLSGAGAPV